MVVVSFFPVRPSLSGRCKRRVAGVPSPEGGETESPSPRLLLPSFLSLPPLEHVLRIVLQFLLLYII